MRLTSALLTSSLLAVLSAGISTNAKADTTYTNQASFAAAAGGLTTVTFGTTDYGGYTFGVQNGGSLSFTSASQINTNNADYYTLNGGLPTYPDGNYLIVYDQPIDVVTIGIPTSTAVGLNLGGTFGPGEVIDYTLSDGTSGVFTASSYVTSGNDLDFLGFTSTTPLTSITLSAVENGDFITLDNVAYSAVTPEPSSLALLGTGLVGACGMVRRRFVK